MAADLYTDDPSWIRPLDRDIHAVFRAETNPRVAAGAPFRRWILKDGQGRTTGRIAAFQHPAQEGAHLGPWGGIGFFECVDEMEAARLLFDAALNWLRAHHCQYVQGPINFGERDRWWGLLAEGFHPPIYGMPYHRPYYQKLFEQYGFEVDFRQFTFRKKLSDGPPPPLVRFAKRAYQLPGYEYVAIDKKHLDQFTRDFRKIYNQAWADYEVQVKPLSEQQAFQLMKDIRPIIDERLMWFAYYEDEPIGFFIMLPDINQIVRKLNGRYGWWEKMKFWYYLRRSFIDNVFGVVFGIVPDHQRKGIESALALSFRDTAQQKNFPYRYLELNWIGDFNKNMIHFAKLLGGKVYKTHITYKMEL